MTARINGSGCTIEVQADTVKSLFELVSEVQEIMGHRDCDMCHEKENLTFRVRKPEGFVYYELHCNGCGADSQFGQRKDGGLFPKGWHKYEPGF